MNFKTTAILLILLVAAGVAIFFTRDTSTPTDTTATVTEKKLLTFSPSDVERISIEPTSGQRIVMKRDGMNWRLVEPVDAFAEPSIVSDILSDLSNLQTSGQVAITGPEAGAMGLVPPHFKVELTTKDSKSIKLDVGDKSATAGQLYVHLDGNAQGDLVAADVYDQLDKPLSDYRRKKLLDVNSTDVQHVEVDRPEGKLVLQKTDAKWTVVQPTTMPADTAAVTDLILGVTGLQATSFVADKTPSPRRYGLNQPAVTVSLGTTPPSTQPTTQPAPMTSVLFGLLDLKKEKVYVSISGNPGIAQVAASTLDTFKKTPLDLRDKQVVNVENAGISTITIQTDLPATTQPTTRPASSTTLVIDRRPTPASLPTSEPTTSPTTLASTEPATKPAPLSKWLVASTQPAADSKVATLLSALHPLRVEKYLEAPPAADKPLDHYTLTIDSAPPVVLNYKIELTDPGNSKPLIGSYNGLTFEVDRTLLDKLKADFTKITPEPSPPDESGPGAPSSFPPQP